MRPRSACTLILIGLLLAVCTGCGANVVKHRAGGITYFTKASSGRDVAASLYSAGTFFVRNGCLLLNYGVRTVIPIFLPDAELNKARRSIVAGSHTYRFDGRKQPVGGSVLKPELTRKQHIPDGSNCGPKWAMLVDGAG